MPSFYGTWRTVAEGLWWEASQFLGVWASARVTVTHRAGAPRVLVSTLH